MNSLPTEMITLILNFTDTRFLSGCKTVSHSFKKASERLIKVIQVSNNNRDSIPKLPFVTYSVESFGTPTKNVRNLLSEFPEKIESYQCHSISDTLLNSMTNLTELIVKDCDLRYLFDTLTVSHLVKLTTLVSETFELGSIKTLTNLTKLDMIHSPHSEAVKSMSKLKDLTLRFDEPDVLEDLLVSLETISADIERFSVIIQDNGDPHVIVKHCTKATSLTIVNEEQLYDLYDGSDFTSLKNLKELNLCGCHNIDGKYMKFLNLTSLTLSTNFNETPTIEDKDIIHMTNLEELNLKNEKISKSPSKCLRKLSMYVEHEFDFDGINDDVHTDIVFYEYDYEN